MLRGVADAAFSKSAACSGSEFDRRNQALEGRRTECDEDDRHHGGKQHLTRGPAIAIGNESRQQRRRIEEGRRREGDRQQEQADAEGKRQIERQEDKQRLDDGIEDEHRGDDTEDHVDDKEDDSRSSHAGRFAFWMCLPSTIGGFPCISITRGAPRLKWPHCAASLASRAPQRRQRQGDESVRRATPVMLVLACLAAAGPARAEDPLADPLQLLERLMRPPAKAVKKALRAATPAPAAKAATPDLVSVPMPRLRPDTVPEPALGYAPASATEAAPLVQPQLSAPPLKSPPPAARSTCGAVIARLGVEATALPALHEGACGIPAPVSVKGLDSGAVAFTTEALLNCDLAETLATWMGDTVQPIAKQTLGHTVTGLRIAASYACRNRDSLADAKLSEHARGNAIDISAFKVAGIGWIDVESGWNGGGAKADFLRQVRASACGPFTTVLGPGSDSYHATHFHLDRAKRRTAGPSHGLYCK